MCPTIQAMDGTVNTPIAELALIVDSYEIAKKPPKGLEPSTSPLPRVRSTN